MAFKKCPRCKGCMEYKPVENRLLYYCDFCRQLYNRIPGGELVKVESVEKFLKERKDANKIT